MTTRIRWALAMMVLLLPCSQRAAAQSVAATSLKAAFLYNFAKFAEWPADGLAAGQRLTLCVLGDGDVADALERTIKGQTVVGHELTMRIVAASGSVSSCHLLYVSASEWKNASALLASARNAPVLTVSDAQGFAVAGGIAQLIVEGDQMRFAINPAAADRARIRLSSKLLMLAKIVKEETDARY